MCSVSPPDRNGSCQRGSVFRRQDHVLFCASVCNKHLGKCNLVIDVRTHLNFEVSHSRNSDCIQAVGFEYRATQDSTCARNTKLADV